MIYAALAALLLANAAAILAIAHHYRAEMKRQADRDAEVIALKDDAIEIAGARADNMEESAAVAWTRYDEMRQARADTVIRLANVEAELRIQQRACAVETERWDRLYALPTLDGIRADSRDNPPDAVALATEFRRDFEAQVVPIRGAKR